jgi:serine/threonine protein kinase
VLKDKWRLDALLGVGGMAWVYAATHRNKSRVAIKLLFPQFSHDEGIRRRFQREGYAANTIDHPSAVHVFDDDVTDDGLAFLVMELLEGTTLAELRKQRGGKLAPKVVVETMDQVLSVLAAAHAKGVIHRDVKPGNIFIANSGQVKVLDFGIARVYEGEVDHEATQNGFLLGSAAFMAPEQARGRWDMVDARTDLWAVGASMFQLLSGRPVHEAATPTERIASAIGNRARSLQSVAPTLSKALIALVDRSLAYEREERFPNALEMQASLRAAKSKLVDLGATLVMEDAKENVTSRRAPAEKAPAAAPVAPPAASVARPADASRALPSSPSSASHPFASTRLYGTPDTPSRPRPEDSSPRATPPPAPVPGTVSAPSAAQAVVPPARASHSTLASARGAELSDASTAAGASLSRDRRPSERRRSPVLVAGVIVVVFGALLLALAGLGLWALQRERAKRESSPIGAPMPALVPAAAKPSMAAATAPPSASATTPARSAP